MQVGMIGLGRMGANMVRRLMQGGHVCTVFDRSAEAVADDPTLAEFEGRVSDSGEGQWTIKAAIDEGVPAPVLSSALYARFGSRGEAGIQDWLQGRPDLAAEALSGVGTTARAAAPARPSGALLRALAEIDSMKRSPFWRLRGLVIRVLRGARMRHRD